MTDRELQPAFPPGVPALSNDEMVAQWIRSMDDAHDAEQFYFMGAWRGYRAGLEAAAALCEAEPRHAGDAQTFYTATGQCAAAIRKALPLNVRGNRGPTA